MQSEPVNDCATRTDGHTCQCTTGGSTFCCSCNESDNDCLPASANAKLENGRSVTMSALTVGDKVQTGNNVIITMSQLTLGDRVITSIKLFTVSQLIVGDRTQTL